MTLLDSTLRLGVPAEAGTLPRDPDSRLRALCDPDTFTAWAPTGTSGVLVGEGLIDGIGVVVHCSDPAVQGGAMGSEGGHAVAHAVTTAALSGRPVIGIWHSGGARLAEGVASLAGVGEVFAASVRASGKVPQISIVLGPAAGGAAYGPALTDYVIMGPAGRVFVTGPDVVRSVTGEDVDADRLGGPGPHGRRSGVVHLLADSDHEALGQARRLVSLLGAQGTVGPVLERDLAGLLPTNARRAYDVHPLVDAVLDHPGLELHAGWAPHLVTTLGRLGGRTVGVVANNPMRLGGCLDSAAAEKAARFVRTCDAFGVPLVVLVDVPGYLPGVGQEWDGVVRRGAKLLHAFAEAIVPRVTLVTHKAYGGAYIAMNSRSLGATAVFAWPGAEIAVMGAESAVGVLRRRDLAAVGEEERPALRTLLAAEHTATVGGLDRALALGVVDSVVEPAATRGVLAQALAAADTGARGQHGNIPL